MQENAASVPLAKDVREETVAALSQAMTAFKVRWEEHSND